MYKLLDLNSIVGQSAALARIKAWLTKPSSCAFTFHGKHGIGKTACAVALAQSLGVDVLREEIGGLHQIASGRQNVDMVRDVPSRLYQLPMAGSGWRVLIVNEADEMSAKTEVAWMDILENLPSRCVVIFTTNNLDKLSERFKDRCRVIEFVSRRSEESDRAVEILAWKTWQDVSGGAEWDMRSWKRIQTAAVSTDGHVSYRRVVKATEQEAEMVGAQ